MPGGDLSELCKEPVPRPTQHQIIAGLKAPELGHKNTESGDLCSTEMGTVAG